MKILKPFPPIIKIDGIEYRMDMIDQTDLMDLPVVDKDGKIQWHESIITTHLKKEGYIE